MMTAEMPVSPIQQNAIPDVVEYIPNDGFEDLNENEVLYMSAESSLYADRDADRPVEVGGSCDDESLYSLPLLSPEGERFLFRKMNYLRFRAAELLDCIRTKGPEEGDLEELHNLLNSADAARNHIAECNLRLVISIARKFATDQIEFDDLVSEAHIILLKAIDKFDFARGFRFSTYATHSVQRHFYRVSKQKQRRRKMELASPSDLMNDLPASEVTGEDELAFLEMEERRLQLLLDRMDECLDEREQFIVRERFGLGGVGVVRTLRDIASDVGLSKERVRQIQLIAVEKLRGFFGQLQLESV